MNVNELKNTETLYTKHQVKSIIEEIFLNHWRLYNKRDGKYEWVGGKVYVCETGKSYAVKNTEELIDIYFKKP